MRVHTGRGVASWTTLTTVHTEEPEEAEFTRRKVSPDRRCQAPPPNGGSGLHSAPSPTPSAPQAAPHSLLLWSLGRGTRGTPPRRFQLLPPQPPSPDHILLHMPAFWEQRASCRGFQRILSLHTGASSAFPLVSPGKATENPEAPNPSRREALHGAVHRGHRRCETQMWGLFTARQPGRGCSSARQGLLSYTNHLAQDQPLVAGPVRGDSPENTLHPSGPLLTGSALWARLICFPMKEEVSALAPAASAHLY